VRSISDRPALLLGLGAILAIAAFHLWITPSNPPGYHRDEAALSLNAYTLSTGLRNEDGARLPLFFRSFEDYKSPVYPYLLAGVFRITGPSGQVARGLSAVLVLAAVLLLGLLARRLTRSNVVAVLVVVVAGLTPWLFELGRIAIEASTQPILVVLLLLVLERTSRLARYDTAHGVGAGAIIGLVTYSYTGSRLLGPLLAGALVVFAGRDRWRFVLAAWAAFLVAMLPIGIYAVRHPGALTARYEATTIARDGLSGARLVAQAVGNWLRDINPWHWATAGDPAPYIHNGGYGAFFAGIALLAIVGAVLVLLRKRSHPFWRFVVLATLLVPVPAALTVDRFNAIRLATLPVFLLVLAIPALASLTGAVRRSWPSRVALAVLLLSIGAQFAQFLDIYRTRGPARLVLYDAGVGPLLNQPLAAGETIYVDFDDRGAQAQARWHVAETGLSQSRIVILPDGGIPPPGSVVFARFQECDYVCEKFARWEQYWLARAIGPRPAEMVDRQFLAARLVAATRRRLAPPVLARIPDTRFGRAASPARSQPSPHRRQSPINHLAV
jgi:dolichyl-phosphate-mannose-protein mannosyltransferase